MRMYKWALPFGYSKKPIFHVLCTHESLQMTRLTYCKFTQRMNLMGM